MHDYILWIANDKDGIEIKIFDSLNIELDYYQFKRPYTKALLFETTK